MPSPPSDSSQDLMTEVYILAEKPVVLSFYGDVNIWAGGLMCDVTFTLVPVDGENYEAKLSLSGGSCTLEISKLKPTEGGLWMRQPDKSAQIATEKCIRPPLR